jgi:hypothetical protein
MGTELFAGSILGLILFILILFAIWLIIRELVCWYYKINERIVLQKRTNDLLEQLLDKLSAPDHAKAKITSESNTHKLTSSSPDDLEIKIFTDDKREHGLMCSEKDLSKGATHSTAKDLCFKYAEGGYTDWRLPTKEELALIYKQLYLKGIGEFQNGNYWTSKEFWIYDAWIQNFSDGKQSKGTQSSLNFVRAVRTF